MKQFDSISTIFNKRIDDSFTTSINSFDFTIDSGKDTEKDGYKS